MSRFDADLTTVSADLFYRFGEQVTLLPPSGQSRAVEAVVTPDEEVVEEGESQEERQERIWVLVRKDESHANGGLADARGYGLKRPGDSDPRSFSFQDRDRNENGNDHELLFARNRLERVGPRQRT